MALPTDNNGRYIAYTGPRYSVVCAVKENGNSPAQEFLEELEISDVAKMTQFMVLFRRIGQDGRIGNPEHFAHEQGDIWTFKRHQHRIPCFQDGKCFVLTHGFKKKRNKWHRSDFEAADAIRKDDLLRISKRKKGPER
jgi:hypothetical protein